MPWAYPLSTHGIGSIRPNIMKVCHANLYPFSCPLHPMVCHAWVDGPIRWRFKVLGIDDSQRGRHELRSLLIGCQAIMRYDTCRFLIGFSPRSKRRFVFCAFQVYILHLSILISSFHSQNTLSERNRHLCQNSPLPIQNCRSYNCQLPVTSKNGEYCYSYMQVFVFVSYI